MINSITVVIVTYKSQNTIFKCLKSISKFNNIYILENSNDLNFKKKINKKFPKIKVFLSKKNNGYGSGYNELFRKVKTKYALIMSPDAYFSKKKLNIFLNSIDKVKINFTLMGPEIQNKKYQIENKNWYNKTKSILGFSFLINLNNIKNKKLFDQNIFLYLEDIDLCKRLLKFNHILITNKYFTINHKGAKSSHLKKGIFDKIRNWHWMWSQFYFSKKHYGILISLIRFIPKLLLTLLKFGILSLLKKKNADSYKFRIKGLYASIMNKNSFLRPNDLI